jgi:hypothetical protein
MHSFALLELLLLTGWPEFDSVEYLTQAIPNHPELFLLMQN